MTSTGSPHFNVDFRYEKNQKCGLPFFSRLAGAGPLKTHEICVNMWPAWVKVRPAGLRRTCCVAGMNTIRMTVHHEPFNS